MTVIFILNVIGVSVLVGLSFIMVSFVTIMAIIALYYSFVKRAAVLFSMFRKLKNSAMQKLGNEKNEKKGHKSVLGTKLNAFSFQESLTLSRRDYIIIFLVAFIMVAGFAGIASFMAFLPTSAAFLATHAPAFLRVFDVAFQLYFMMWECIVFSLPVLLILHMILNYGVEKVIRKLEKFA